MNNKRSNIRRGLVLLTVALFATVAMASTASAGPTELRGGLWECAGSSSSNGGVDTCIGVFSENSETKCIGYYWQTGDQSGCLGTGGP